MAKKSSIKFKDRKLSTKLAVIIGAIVIVMPAVIIGIAVITSKNPIQKVAFAEMEARASGIRMRLNC